MKRKEIKEMETRLHEASMIVKTITDIDSCILQTQKDYKTYKRAEIRMFSTDLLLKCETAYLNLIRTLEIEKENLEKKLSEL